jgi:hypothetical protein
MAITVSIWARDIARTIFPDNTFMERSMDDTAFAENGHTVELPQSGGSPAVVVNRSSFPGTATQRTDTTATYVLDWHTSDPTSITTPEEIEVSYDKRREVLSEHTDAVSTSAAGWLLYRWAPTATNATQYVRTTGSNRTAWVSGATGNRKKAVLADLLNVKRLFDLGDIPQEGRCALFAAEMYNDILEIDEIKTQILNNSQSNLATGVVARIFGFDVYIRSSVVSYTNESTPALRTPDASALSTANGASLFWHPMFVRRAKGSVEVFIQENSPLYFGTVMSTGVRAGGRAKYTNQRGIVALIETTP